jgi:hypothetical protein
MQPRAGGGNAVAEASSERLSKQRQLTHCTHKNATLNQIAAHASAQIMLAKLCTLYDRVAAGVWRTLRVNENASVKLRRFQKSLT